MKTELDEIPTMTIEEFADKHDLVMKVSERRLPPDDPSRYYASFKNTELKGDGVLIGTYGNGATHEQAIAAYAKEINLKTLVISAYGEDRREISVPRLIAD